MQDMRALHFISIIYELHRSVWRGVLNPDAFHGNSHCSLSLQAFYFLLLIILDSRPHIVIDLDPGELMAIEELY